MTVATEDGSPPKSAPRYNLMDRDVQPPGYNVYREKKEGFTDCTWHVLPAECCMWYYVCRHKQREGGSCCAGLLGACNSIIYSCCCYVPHGRFCPGRRCPCCVGQCGETLCCPLSGPAFIDRINMNNRGPGWVKQAKSSAQFLDHFSATAEDNWGAEAAKE